MGKKEEQKKRKKGETEKEKDGKKQNKNGCDGRTETKERTQDRSCLFYVNTITRKTVSNSRRPIRVSQRDTRYAPRARANSRRRTTFNRLINARIAFFCKLQQIFMRTVSLCTIKASDKLLLNDTRKNTAAKI